jgi:DNA-binding beta-propeller fold protein YncE
MFGKQSVGGMGCLLAAFLMVALPADLWSQKRIYATVDPQNETAEQKLIFDTNQSPDDNVSPTVVLTPDGTRGFVGYAGSGVVVEFSMQDGAILNRIATGGRPSLATRTPDSRALLVTSALDNRVFLVDMVQSSLLATFTFPGAQFGFGSNVVASPDGRTGYISSTGTGDVIRFSIPDGAETGRLSGLRGPAQLTLTPDGATLLVVDTLAEEAVVADASAMTRRAALDARRSNPLANFTIFNRAVLSPDGSAALVASRDLNGVIDFDTAFIFRTSNGELLHMQIVGTEPGFTGLTPDGSEWVIYTEFGIWLLPVSDPAAAREVGIPRGGALGSANIVFSPDSRFAYYASSSSNAVFQQDLISREVVEQLLVGTNPLLLLEQPSSMAITPDGKALAVVNFTSNKISLLREVTVAVAIKYVNSPEQFTGLTLINLSPRPTKIIVTALDSVGNRIQEEGVTNPAEFDFLPNNQFTLTVEEIFHFDGSQETAGWLKITSDEPEIAGYVSIGDRSLSKVDGYPIFTRPLSEWIVPEVVRQEGKSVELVFFNPLFNQASYDIDRRERTGNSLEVREDTSTFGATQTRQPFGDLFTSPEVATDGYLRVQSTGGMYFAEFFGDDNTSAASSGIDVNAFTGINKVYAPLFAVTPAFQTRLNVINASAEAADVTITLRNSNGAPIGQAVTRTFAAGEQLKDDLAAIFADTPLVNDVGWIEIASTQDRILGAVTITTPDDVLLASFQLSGAPSRGLLFPGLAQNDQYQTGIALLNGDSALANVILEVWGPGGTLDRSTSFTLAPGQQHALYLDSYFPNLEPRLVGNVRVRSDRPLHGLAFINDRSLNFISALPAVPLP